MKPTRVLLLSVLVAATLALTSSQAHSAVTVYSQEFEGGQQPLPSEWASGVGVFGASAGSYGSYSEVGAGFLLNESMPAEPSVLVLRNLPLHTSVSIGFLLAIINSWDGYGSGSVGPDSLNVLVDSQLVFAEVFARSSGSQTYSPPPSVRWGSDFYNMYAESRFSAIPHTDSTLVIQWYASGPGWQGGGDESWAIDHVLVSVNTPTATGYAPAHGECGDTITVSGTDLDQVSGATISGRPVVIVSKSSTFLQFLVPAEASSGPIVLNWLGGAITLTPDFEVLFRPLVLRAVPDSGKVNDTVRIYGRYFSGATGVLFGTAPNTPITVIADSEIVTVLGTDAVSGPITVTRPHVSGVSAFQFRVLPLDPRPTLMGVRDVPNDQGGKVFVYWRRSDLDVPQMVAIMGYRIWRRMPLLVGTERSSLNEVGKDPAQGVRLRYAVDGSGVIEYWELVGEMQARFLDGYAFAAPTTQDSLPGSNPFTAFFVEASYSQVPPFYDSAVDSGYSVDNLRPAQPAPFTALYRQDGVALHWGVSTESDLREYRLYRGASPNFIPSPSNLLVAQPDTGFFDPGGAASFAYKLSAVDIHGNESRFALVTAGGPVGTLASLMSAEVEGSVVRLRWLAVANPGLSATVYRRTPESTWTALGHVAADGTGIMAWDDAQVGLGQRYGYRLGVWDGGVEIFLGEAWIEVPTLTFALEGVRPNPSRGEALLVSFSLPDAAPARLELLDVSGRRVAEREAGSLGVGHHTLDLREGRPLAPGLYLVRLTQGTNTRVTRVVVLR